jgi:hypothetical protein
MNQPNIRRLVTDRGRPPLYARVEAVLKLIPADGSEITTTRIVNGLARPPLRLPRRTALRWLKEASEYRPAGPYRILQSRSAGRNRYYSYAMTGFMTEEAAKAFLLGEGIHFLRKARELAPAYSDSEESMTLFWRQASGALVRSFFDVLEAAQSISLAQIHTRAMPSETIARQQADVLVEAFVRRWTADLVASFHLFLEIERERNWPGRLGKPSRGAPSAVAGYRAGWAPVVTEAFEQWRSHRNEGGWGRWIQEQRDAQERELKRIASEASAAVSKSSV